MLKYVVKRLLYGAITLFALMAITFFLMHSIPGSPFAGEMSKLPANVKELMIQHYQLDQPTYVQFISYLKNVLQGDFGTSLVRKGQNVMDIINRGLPYTAKLGACAFCVAMVLGVLLGAVSAFSKKKWVQGLTAFIATIGVSVPSFLFALFLMYVLGVWLKILPIIGLNSPQSFVMPSIALAMSPIAMISRLTKSSLSEELRQDYITNCSSNNPTEQDLINYAKDKFKDFL